MSFEMPVETPLVCPGCGMEAKFPCWTEVDVVANPALREQILSGELFVFHCPSCFLETPISYPMVYDDSRRKIRIRVVETRDEALAIDGQAINIFKERIDALEYRTRVVVGRRRLIEKIKVLEAEHDDFVVEMQKHALLRQLPTSAGRVDLYFVDSNRDELYYVGFDRASSGVRKIAGDIKHLYSFQRFRSNVKVHDGYVFVDDENIESLVSFPGVPAFVDVEKMADIVLERSEIAYKDGYLADSEVMIEKDVMSGVTEFLVGQHAEIARRGAPRQDDWLSVLEAAKARVRIGMVLGIVAGIALRDDRERLLEYGIGNVTIDKFGWDGLKNAALGSIRGARETSDDVSEFEMMVDSLITPLPSSWLLHTGNYTRLTSDMLDELQLLFVESAFAFGLNFCLHNPAMSDIKRGNETVRKRNARYPQAIALPKGPVL